MQPVVLIVLDGFGVAPPSKGNAIFQAHPHNINSYIYSYPYTQLKASGEAVGLPHGEVGNTEVGHLNLGAGHVVYQSLLRINVCIADGSFYKNIAFLESLYNLSKTKGRLHLMGLVSDGSVHSNIDHLYALLNFCKQNSFSNVFIHAFTDGRDSPPHMALTYLTNLQHKLDSLGIGQIASIMGRYYAMDRDRRWNRTMKAYFCLTQGIGHKVDSCSQAVEQSYKKQQTDEFIEPTVIMKNSSPIALIQEGDAVIFFNFRIDRPRQLTKAFVLDDFDTYIEESSSQVKNYTPLKIYPKNFKRGKKIQNLYFITMTEYERNLPTIVAFPPHIISVCLGRVLSDNSINQLRMAESEKERFVTYYFNGLREKPFPLEDRIIIPSLKIPTYDLQPAMSARKIASTLIQQIATRKYPFILVNFANADMIGHTGNFSAGIEAVKTIDSCVGQIVSVARQYNYAVLITADHGNIEEMIDLKTGMVSTEHTGNSVPLVIISDRFKDKPLRLDMGILADVAPTILAMMQIPKSNVMTGRNLLQNSF